MKLSLFAHVERTTKAQTYDELHAQFIELCLMADEAGFEKIWTGEHHSMDFTISPNPFLLLSELAQITKNVRLGTGTIVAPFWHPVRLAGEAGMTDQITKGRLEIGIARGAYQYEYDRLGNGMDAWTAGQHLREMIPALHGLLQGEYEMDGECWSFPKSTAVPKAYQDRDIPIYVAARDPSSFEFGIENDCNIQVTPLWLGDEEVVSLMEKFKAAKSKFPDKKPKSMVLRHVYVGANEEEVAQGAKDLSNWYCHFGAWFKNERPIENGLIKPLSDEEMSKIEMYSPENMRKNNIVGTPDQVIERIKTYEDLGYDELSVWIDTGASFANRKKNLQLFIDEVLPEFQ